MEDRAVLQLKAGLDSRIALRCLLLAVLKKIKLTNGVYILAKALTQKLRRIATTRADEMEFIMLHCDACTSAQFLVVIGQQKKKVDHC